MGSQTHNPPKTEFAHRLNAYFRAQIEDRGWDASGRRMEAAVDAGGPKRTVWAKFYAGEQSMNANEIAIAARAFGMSPYEFVEAARTYAPANVTQLPNVGGTADDEYQQEARGKQSPPARKVAKRGKLKGDRAFEGGNEGTDSDGGAGGA